MFTKRKLAKLIEKQDDNKQEINYEILHKAKEETHWNDACEVKAVDNRKQQLIITATICCLLILISLGIFLGITLSKPNNPLEPPIHYSYSEDNVYKYVSVEKYNEDKNINILYFKNYQDVDEVVTIYTDNGSDVLLSQDVILLDTYEQIKLFVELKDNYIFEFLSNYESLSSEIIINGVKINYNTKFDEELYLYKTFTKFIYQGHVYRICFDLEGETDWQEEISKLLA